MTSLFFAIVFLKDEKPRTIKIKAIHEEEISCLSLMQDRMKEYKKHYDFLIVNYMSEDAGVTTIRNWLDSLGFPKAKALGVISGLGDEVKRLCQQ